jgi:hypothetical protein
VVSTSEVGCIVCEPPCKSVNYDASFSFLKTSENDITKLESKFREKIMKVNQEALDIHINIDKELYQKYLEPIKAFKKSAINARKVYGNVFYDDVNKHRKNFTRLADKCKHSLNKTARYFGVMNQFYDEFFYSAAALRFPDVSLGSGGLAMNVEKSLRLVTMNRDLTIEENDFVRVVKYELSKTVTAINEASSSLKDILTKYSTATPVMPYVKQTDIMAALNAYNGVFYKRPITDVTTSASTSKRVAEYENLAKTNTVHLKELVAMLKGHNASKPVDWATFSVKKNIFINDMLKLGSIRLEVMKKSLKLPMDYVDWRNQSMLQAEAASKAMSDRIVTDMQDHFDLTSDTSFKINAMYESWVDRLNDGGLLDISGITRHAQTADQGIETNRLQYTIYRLREYLTEAIARFSGLQKNYKTWERAVYAASKKASMEIIWIPAYNSPDWKRNEKMVYGVLDTKACIDFEEERYWSKYFDKVKGDIEEVVEVIVPQFEKLKTLLDEYAEGLEPTGTFYK